MTAFSAFLTFKGKLCTSGSTIADSYPAHKGPFTVHSCRSWIFAERQQWVVSCRSVDFTRYTFTLWPAPEYEGLSSAITGHSQKQKTPLMLGS